MAFDYTIVGTYETDESFVHWVTADSPEDAVAKLPKVVQHESALPEDLIPECNVIAVFKGGHFDEWGPQ